jgi:hypothetical protein
MASLSTSRERVTQDASSSGKPAPLFDLRFSLTESEWREAGALLHPISGGAYAKPWLRLFCGFCAVANLMAPALNGTSWSELIQCAPGRAAFAALGAVACASGAIWMKSLDHRLNRIDLERHIIMTDASVTVTRNERTWNHRWQDFAYFREGQNIVILRNPGVRYWTIPLRAIPADRQLHFRKLLCNKLARRQPYSWSSDSSGVPR